MLTMYIIQLNPLKRPRGVFFTVHPLLKRQVCFIYTLHIYYQYLAVEGRKLTSYRGGGESSSKFNSFYYIYYTYTLYKL